MDSKDKYLNTIKQFYDQNININDIVGDPAILDVFDWEKYLLNFVGDESRPILRGKGVALDFGCGPGRMISRLNPRFERIDGVDISARLLNIARKECPKSNFYITKGNDLGGAPKNHYDYIYSTLCFQHIASRSIRNDILKSISEHLKETGVCVIQTAFADEYEGTQHAKYTEDRYTASETNSKCDGTITKKDWLYLIYDINRIFNKFETLILKNNHDNSSWDKCGLYIYLSNKNG